jgi:hypothetical protein
MICRCKLAQTSLQRGASSSGLEGMAWVEVAVDVCDDYRKGPGFGGWDCYSIRLLRFMQNYANSEPSHSPSRVPNHLETSDTRLVWGKSFQMPTLRRKVIERHITRRLKYQVGLSSESVLTYRSVSDNSATKPGAAVAG